MKSLKPILFITVFAVFCTALFFFLRSKDIFGVIAATFDSDLVPGSSYTYTIGQPGSPWQNTYLGDGSTSSPAYTFSADTGLGLFRAGSNILGFSTAGTERMRIDASGNLGVGMTNPSYKLDITGGLRATATSTFSGYLGIGTSSPLYALDVNGVSKTNSLIFSPSSSNPTPAATGQFYYNSVSNKPFFYNGSTWGEIGGGGANYALTFPSLKEDEWVNTGATLPGNLYSSSLAVIGDYVYLFGGNNGTAATNVIYRAPVSDPTSWTNTGSTIPGNLFGSSSDVIGSYVYLFGGFNAAISTSSLTKVIYRAPVSNPTSWTNPGSTLPIGSGYGSYIREPDTSYIDIVGGYMGSAITSRVLRSTTSNPTSWSNYDMYVDIYGASVAQIGSSNSYLFGGYNNSNTVTNEIYKGSATNWLTYGVPIGYTLPGSLALSSTAVIGKYVYLFGGRNATTATNVIYRAPVSNPTNWANSGKTLPGNLYGSSLAIIGDYVYLFGGHNGTTATNVIYRAPIYNISPNLSQNKSWNMLESSFSSY